MPHIPAYLYEIAWPMVVLAFLGPALGFGPITA